VRKPPSRRSTRHMLYGPFRTLSTSHVQLESGSRRTKASAQCCAVPHHHSHRRAGRSASPDCRSCATTAEGGDPSSCPHRGGQTGPVRCRSYATTALVNNPSVLCGRTNPHSTLLLYGAEQWKARGYVGLSMGVYRRRDNGPDGYLRGHYSLNRPTQKSRRRAASSPLQLDAIIASNFVLFLQCGNLKIARKLPQNSSKCSTLLPDASCMMGKDQIDGVGRLAKR
jgi:hypothetical protein